MTLLLELPAELEKELAIAAEEAGLSLADYSLQLLALRSLPEAQLKTGTDLVNYWRRLDLIGMRQDIDNSQQHARQIRESANHRQIGE